MPTKKQPDFSIDKKAEEMAKAFLRWESLTQNQRMDRANIKLLLKLAQEYKTQIQKGEL